MPALSPETIRRAIDAATCDTCRTFLFVGAEAIYDDATGGVYCSRDCAREDAADRGHGGGPLTSGDGLSQADRYAIERERIGNDPAELDNDDDQAEAGAFHGNPPLCPACRRPWNPAVIPPPRVPLNIRCACCCQ